MWDVRQRLPEGGDIVNILVCGVGGQGVILFSDLLAAVAAGAGLDVKKSEVHGMAQRGGSVNTHLRYGSRVFSPLIEEGTADLLVAFEMLEALRCVHFLSGRGRLVYDPYRLDPLPVQLGLVERPDSGHLEMRLEARAPTRTRVPAFELARQLGSPRVQNAVMLGVVSRFLQFPVESYRNAMRVMLKPEFVQVNFGAFDAGAGLQTADLSPES